MYDFFKIIKGRTPYHFFQKPMYGSDAHVFLKGGHTPFQNHSVMILGYFFKKKILVCYKFYERKATLRKFMPLAARI